MDKRLLVQLTADIVAAHASANEMGQGDLLQEIDFVFRKLSNLHEGTEEALAAGEEPRAEQPAKPAVPLAAAFGAQKVFCMVCGEGMKTLKRHLSTAHGMKPGQYRRAFGIPSGTALVAKDYSEARKKMAKDLNLADRLVKARAARKSKAAAATNLAPEEPPAPKVARQKRAAKVKGPTKRTAPVKTAPQAETPVPAEVAAPKVIRRKRTAKAE